MKKNIFILAALATMTLYSCSSDDGADVIVDMTDKPININVGVASTSRVGYDTDADLQASTFGLFLNAENKAQGKTGSGRYGATNLEIAYSAGKWAAANGTQLLWKSADSKVYYIAYMPYSSSAVLTDSTLKHDFAVSVQKDQRVISNVVASDFLYAKLDSTEASTVGIDVTFKHALSKLYVGLKLGSEVATVEIDSVKVKACTGNSSTFDIETGLLNAVDLAAQTDSVMLYKVGELEFEGVLIPQTYAKTLVVEVYANNGQTYVYESDEDLIFKQGWSYRLPLKVSRDIVRDGEIKATAWTVKNGGTLKTE
jgi:hypothetical protein